MPGGRLSYAEALAQERGTDVPDEDLTATGQLRRALFRGEALTALGTAERFGVSPGFLAQAVAVMERMGYVFTRATEGDDPAYRYRLTNPEHTPSEAQVEAQRAHSYAKQSATRKARSARTGAAPVAVTEPPPTSPERHGFNYAPDLPPLPDLGAGVMVYALALNDDGTVTLGLRNGSRRWMTTVTGATEVTA